MWTVARTVTAPGVIVDPVLFRREIETTFVALTHACAHSSPVASAALHPRCTDGVTAGSAPVTVIVCVLVLVADNAGQVIDAEAVSIDMSVLIWLAVR